MGVEPADVDEVIMTQAHADQVGPRDGWRADLLSARAPAPRAERDFWLERRVGQVHLDAWRLASGIEDLPVHQWSIPVADPGNATGAIGDQEAHA